MASTGPLISDYAERIVDILESNGISPTPAKKVFAKIEALRASSLDIHPTYSFRVMRDGRPLFFRVLVRNDPELRMMRMHTASVLQHTEA